MTDIKKELIDFKTHCLETGQLQVAELQSNAIKRIAELEEELKFLYEVACEGTNPEWLQEQINALKEQGNAKS